MFFNNTKKNHYQELYFNNKGVFLSQKLNYFWEKPTDELSAKKCCNNLKDILLQKHVEHQNFSNASVLLCKNPEKGIYISNIIGFDKFKSILIDDGCYFCHNMSLSSTDRMLSQFDFQKQVQLRQIIIQMFIHRIEEMAHGLYGLNINNQTSPPPPAPAA